MSRDKQIDIIRDLLVEFDEMGFIPSTAVPNHEAYAIKWRAEITKALEDYFKQSDGEWIAKKDYAGYGYYCSNCNAVFTGENAEWIAKEHRFCPKCGAKMKGGE